MIALKLAYSRNKLFKTLHYWSSDALNFDFLDKGLGIASPAHFVHDFSIKMFLVLYSINWPNFIAWLPLLLDILGNMCIAIICFPGCDVMDFEINIIFRIEPFFLHDQKKHLTYCFQVNMIQVCILFNLFECKRGCFFLQFIDDSYYFGSRHVCWYQHSALHGNKYFSESNGGRAFVFCDAHSEKNRFAMTYKCHPAFFFLNFSCFANF